MSEVFFTRVNIHNLLALVIGNLRTHLNDNEYPSLREVNALLEKMRFPLGTRQALAKESAVGRLNTLCNQLGEMPNCRSGYPMPELMKHSIVYNLASLGRDVAQFITHLKLAKVVMFREAQLEEQDAEAPALGTDIFVVEEAHRTIAQVFERRAESEPLLYDATRSWRKRGSRFWFTEQILASIPYQVLGNIGNRIIGKITDGRSLRLLAQLTGWDNERIETIRRLPQRCFVFHSSEFPDGILFRVPDLN